MAIPIQCSCGKSEEVPETFAGKRVRCRACGARIDIGQPALETPDMGGDGYSSPNRGNRIISRERMLAGRSAYCWAAIMTAFALLFALLVGFVSAHGMRGEPLLVAGSVLAMLLGSAVVYLLSGMYIQRGGMAWVIVCLVLATVQGVFSGLTSIVYLVNGLRFPPALVFAAISVLATAALGQLLYYLIRILCERRMLA